MTCLGHYCMESEYKAEVTKSDVKVVSTDDECSKKKLKQEASDLAEKSLQEKLAGLNEKDDAECKKMAECTCGEMPDWPKDGGWTKEEKDQKWTTPVGVGLTCQYEVTLTYTRLYRERKAPCIKKIPAKL